MAAARRFSDVAPEVLERTAPHSLLFLCRSYIPDAVVATAIAVAAGGEMLTSKRAQEIVREAGVQPVSPSAGVPRMPLHADRPDRLLMQLTRALDTLAGGLEQIVAGWEPEQRSDLADRLLNLALRLRTVGAPAAEPSKIRQRAAAVAG